jgi:hypothetical protein
MRVTIFGLAKEMKNDRRMLCEKMKEKRKKRQE